MRREIIQMPYIGSCLSVNHRLGRRRDGGYFVKPEAREWQCDFMWLLKRLHLEEWQLPIEVTCSAVFRNEHRACDLVNFQKAILDPIQELTGINDKNMRWHDGKRTIDPKQQPHLLIALSEPTRDSPQIALQCPTVPLAVETKGILPPIKRGRGRPRKQ